MEAHLTGMEVEKLDKTLAQFVFIFLPLTTLFITVAQVSIKMYFKRNPAVVKQRYKSLVSFKTLRILFILINIVCGIFVVPFVFTELKKKINFTPYMLQILGICLLTIILIENKDAMKYWKRKYISYIEQKNLGKTILRGKCNKIYAGTCTDVSPKIIDKIKVVEKGKPDEDGPQIEVNDALEGVKRKTPIETDQHIVVVDIEHFSDIDLEPGQSNELFERRTGFHRILVGDDISLQANAFEITKLENVPSFDLETAHLDKQIVMDSKTVPNGDLTINEFGDIKYKKRCQGKSLKMKKIEKMKPKKGPSAITSKTQRRNLLARVDKTLSIDLENLPLVIFIKEAVDGENSSDIRQRTEQCVSTTANQKKEEIVFDDNIMFDDFGEGQNISFPSKVFDNITDTTVKKVHDAELGTKVVDNLNLVDIDEIEENDSITEVFDGLECQNLIQGSQLFIRKTPTQRKQMIFFVNDMIVEDI